MNENQNTPYYGTETKEWVWRYLLSVIPVIGTIFLIVTLCSKSTAKSVKNWAAARLIFSAIVFLICAAFVFFIIYLITYLIGY